MTTPPFFVWKDSFALGVPTIDGEHHEFFNIINRLYDATTRRQASSTTNQGMAELKSYARYHFKHEEELLESIAYPNLRQQRDQHSYFVRHLEQLEQDKSLPEQAVLGFARDWLLHHILGSDKEFSSWLSEHPQDRPSADSEIA